MSIDAFARSAAALDAETTIRGLLGAACRELVELTGATACAISRVIGDLLVDLVQHRRTGKQDRLGHGYLISDFPMTRAVIETRRPETVYTGDEDADEAEATLLVELGFDSLLMLAIEAEDTAWGLVEVYGNGRRFDSADIELAQALSVEAGDVLERLSRPAQ